MSPLVKIVVISFALFMLYLVQVSDFTGLQIREGGVEAPTPERTQPYPAGSVVSV